MKKTILLLCALSLLASSCVKEVEQPTGPANPTMKGEYYAGVSGAKETVELFPGASQTFDIRAYARGNSVCDATVNLNFKAAPAWVDAYNKKFGTDYEMCPGSAFEFTKGEVMMPRYGTSSTTGKVKIVASGLDAKKVYILPITLEDAKEGQLFNVADTLGACIVFKQIDLDITKGMGTAEAPFMIYDVEDLKNICSKCQEGALVYFKMANDIDMAGVTDWVPLNPTPAFKMDFDGNGCTISNFSSDGALFGGFAGKIHDLNIVNANVSGTSSFPAILAYQLGDSQSAATAEHINIQGILNNASTTGTGAIAGRGYNATVNACSVDITLTSGGADAAGIIGYDNGGVCTISNCLVTGQITSNGKKFTGGIIGQITQENTSVYNCCVTARIEGHYSWGGIAGYANNSDASVGSWLTLTPGNHIEKCIVWSDYLGAWKRDEGTSEHWPGGVIVGLTATHNYLANCYRNPDLEFVEWLGNAVNVPCDQANASPDTPLQVPWTHTYCYSYHGKAAAAGETCSDVARKLGYDESIWDLSGSVPALKGAGLPVVPDVNAGGQLPDFDENEFYN